MNYLKAYCTLIRKAKHRVLPEGYTEKHHIFPVSIYGNNNKIVILTGREHYVAHALLEKAFIKRYGIDDIRAKKMITAFWCMNNQKTKNEYLNSHLFEASKIRFVEVIKNRKITEQQRKKLSISSKNRIWWTDGVTTKFSENCPGESWYKGRVGINFGRIMSEETKRKISKKNKGKKLSKEHKEIISNQVSQRRWWTNGNQDKHCIECPGDGWVLGRTAEPWCKGKKNIFSQEVIEKNIERMLKYEYTIKNPEGEIYTFNNLNKFCKENDLTSNSMRSVVKGNNTHHKGWTAVTVKELSTNPPKPQ